MNILNSYQRSKLDLGPLGLQRGERESGYFCTPVQSKVIGWTGVDGIHFCTTKGFEEMIFAVSPMNTPGNYVHPVARNFEDFLRLLLACHDTAAIEQCWFMDREVFEQFVENNPPTEEMQACLDAIEKKYSLTPMKDPFAYIQELQKCFDYSQLRFPPEYCEWVEEPPTPQAPEWKVTWDGDFFDASPDSVGAEAVEIGGYFRWADIDWYVPEVYPFDRGVVLYVLGRIDPAKVRLYAPEALHTVEEQERMDAENPLNLHVRPELSMNGLALRPAGSMGITWMPGEGWNSESRWVLEHYGLDQESAWQINRMKFFWPECGRLEMEKMRLTMRQNPVSVSGTHFKTPSAGEQVKLYHPWTGAGYVLFVESLNRETADFRNLDDRQREYPACYTQMVYRIQPEPDRNQFRIVDCGTSDQPRYRKDAESPENEAVISLGIIGGADGPIILGHPKEPETQFRTAYSSLRFAHPAQIEWRIVFQERPNEDLTVSLI